MPKEQKISRNIQEIIIDNPKTKNEKISWVNVVNARKGEIEYLRKKYNFQLSHLQASSGSVFAQRPAIYNGETYLFIILHFPVYLNGTIVASEIDFFIGHGYLITLHNGNVGALNEFFNFCKKDNNSLLAYEFESSTVLLYELLEKLILDCYRLLDKNSIKINQMEEVIFSNDQKKAVSQILFLRRNIINFRKIMQNHKNILQKLMEMKSSLVPAEIIRKYYKRLVEHSKTIWDILENQKEVVEALDSTNESLLNDHISNIMKTLTIFSVIVFPLTLLAAIFGMNVEDGMPFINTPSGFWIIIAVMITGSLGMLLFFERKGWL